MSDKTECSFERLLTEARFWYAEKMENRKRKTLMMYFMSNDFEDLLAGRS